jgi:hypothetical protein
MAVYDFEVLKDGAVIAANQTIALPDTRAAWPKVVELAKTFDKPGYKIRVRDEAGCHPNRRRHASPLRQRGFIWHPPAFARGSSPSRPMINGPEKETY